MAKVFVNEKKAFPVICRHFDGLMWMIRACAKKDDPRLNMRQSFLVQDGICFATDGHRMHVYCQELDDLPSDLILEDGHYMILSATKKSLIVDKKPDDAPAYPDPWAVLKYKPINGIPDFVTGNEDDYSMFIYHVMKNVTAFNVDYLIEAMIPESKLHFERMGPSSMNGLVFGNENKFAIVMPLKIEKNS